MSSVGSIAVIGAHAFDAEIMAGGVIARYGAAGAHVDIVHMTLGEQGHRSLSAQEYAAQKRKEAEQAAKILGASPSFMPYKDTDIPCTLDSKLAMCDTIREIRPEVIITHWHGSWHKDHVAAYNNVMEGLFYASLPTFERSKPAHAVKKVLFAHNWEDHHDFKPTVFVDVSDVYEKWMAAVECYELSHPGFANFPYNDYYSAVARANGCLNGVQYAQGFMELSPQDLIGLGQFAPMTGSVL